MSFLRRLTLEFSRERSESAATTCWADRALRCRQSLCDYFWCRRCDPEERLCRSFRTTPALFPVLECRDAHADHKSKLRLRLTKPGAYGFDIGRGVPKLSRRCGFAPANATRLPDACGELFEVVSLHLNSSATTRPSARS